MKEITIVLVVEDKRQDEVIRHFKDDMALEYGYREGLDYVIEIREAY